MQDFAGSTVVHYQGALAGLAGAILLGPRIGKFGSDHKPNAIPGHNMAFTTLGVIILWFGWFGFNPGSTLSVDFGGVGFFAYVALNTNLAAAAGVLGAVVTSWIVVKKPDLSMMLNGAIAALVAITAACAFVAPWAAILIGFVSGIIVVVGSLLVERVGLDDPVGAIAAHGMSGVWGTLSLGFLAVPKLASNLETGTGGLFYGGGFHQLGIQALGLARGRRLHVHRLVPDPAAVQGDVRHPHRARGRGDGPRRLRARHVGLPRVLHPGPGRLRLGADRPAREAVHRPRGDRRPRARPATACTSSSPARSRSSTRPRAGEDQQLATLKPGEFFGEMAIFEDEVRSATVRAVGDTRVLEVDKKTVEKRIQDDPRLAVNMLKTMSSRIREGHTRLDGASVPDA